MLRIVARAVAVRASWAVAATAILVVALPAAPAAARSHARTAKAVSCPGVDVRPSLLGTERTQKALLCLVNWERASTGQRPLVLDGRLTLAAQVHSDDMVAHDYFGHTQEELQARLAGAGYPWSPSGTANENIAVGQSTVRKIVTVWLGSTGPCTSLLSPHVTAMGVGVNAGGIGRFGGPTWTLTLGRTAAEPDPAATVAAATCPTTPAAPAPTDSLGRFFRYFVPWQYRDEPPGGVGTPAVVVPPPPPAPPVVVPPAVTPPPEPHVELDKVRRSKRTLRLHLTLPLPKKTSKKDQKSKGKSKSDSKSKAKGKHKKGKTKKAKKRSERKSKKRATARGLHLSLIAASVDGDAKKPAAKKAKKQHSKKRHSSKKAKKKTKKKQQDEADQVTVRLRVIQKGQKARTFTFRRAGGRTYRLRIRLRKARHGTVRVRAAGQKVHARFK